VPTTTCVVEEPDRRIMMEGEGRYRPSCRACEWTRDPTPTYEDAKWSYQLHRTLIHGDPLPVNGC
jgi:hypothetical protein